MYSIVKKHRLLPVIMVILWLSQTSMAPYAMAQAAPPAGPASRLTALSPQHTLPTLKGLRIDPDSPLMIDFIVGYGDEKSASKEEVARLVRYFMAGLTVADQDLWVNLSPYEADRIMDDNLVTTELGEDMLNTDYILKQLASSLTYPESEAGKAYWQAIQTHKGKVQAFNKVWIVPDKVKLYEHDNMVVVARATLKVETEADYLAAQQNHSGVQPPSAAADPATIAFKTHILPLIEKEVNTGKNFARLRQMYTSLLLAKWFKEKFRQSFYRYYIDAAKVNGINLAQKGVKEKIYNMYREAFQKGAYDYVRKDLEDNGISLPMHKTGKRRYICGGLDPLAGQTGEAQTATDSEVSNALGSRPGESVRVRVEGNVPAKPLTRPEITKLIETVPSTAAVLTRSATLTERMQAIDKVAAAGYLADGDSLRDILVALMRFAHVSHATLTDAPSTLRIPFETHATMVREGLESLCGAHQSSDIATMLEDIIATQGARIGDGVLSEAVFMLGRVGNDDPGAVNVIDQFLINHQTTPSEVLWSACQAAGNMKLDDRVPELLAIATGYGEGEHSAAGRHSAGSVRTAAIAALGQLENAQTNLKFLTEAPFTTHLAAPDSASETAATPMFTRDEIAVIHRVMRQHRLLKTAEALLASKAESHDLVRDSLRDQIDQGIVFCSDPTATEAQQVLLEGAVAVTPAPAPVEISRLHKLLKDLRQGSLSNHMLGRAAASTTVTKLAAHLGKSETEVRNELVAVARSAQVLLIYNWVALYNDGPLYHARLGQGSDRRGPGMWMGARGAAALNNAELLKLCVEIAKHIIAPELDYEGADAGIFEHDMKLIGKLVRAAMANAEKPSLRPLARSAPVDDGLPPGGIDMRNIPVGVGVDIMPVDLPGIDRSFFSCTHPVIVGRQGVASLSSLVKP